MSPKRPRLVPSASTSLALLLAGAVFGAGCGPFGYVKRVATDSTRAVSFAEASNAETHAPYEYWGAKAYLEQSKIMMAYSEYERSFDYGDRAKDLATEAKIKADRVEAGESVEHSEGIAAPDEVPEERAERPTPKAEAKKTVTVGGGK